MKNQTKKAKFQRSQIAMAQKELAEHLSQIKSKDQDGEGSYDPFSLCMPVIDSKEAIKASPIVEKHLGIKLKPSMIQKGGYDDGPESAAKKIILCAILENQIAA